MSRNRKAFWLMFAGAIVVRGLMAVYMIVNQTYIAEDTITYVNPARELLASGRFYVGDMPEMLRTPVYPILIAGGILLTGEHYPVFVIVIQILMNLAGFFLWDRLVDRYVKWEPAANLAKVFYLFDLFSIYYTCMLLTDALFQVGILLFLYLMMKIFDSPKLRYAIGLGILFGCMALLRPIIMYLPICIFVGLTVVYISQKQYRNILHIGTVMLVLAMIPIIGWSCRNYSLSGRFGVSDVNKSNMYVYYASAIEADLSGGSYYDAVSRRMDYLSSVDNHYEDPEVITNGKELVMDNLPIFAKYCARGVALELGYPGMMNVLSSVPEFYEGTQTIKNFLLSGGSVMNRIGSCAKYVLTENRVFLLGCFALAVDVILLLSLLYMSIRFVFNRKYRCQWYEKWMLIGVWAYFLLCSCMPFGIGGYSRFRLPFLYVMVLCAAMYRSDKKDRQGKRIS